MEIIQAIIVFLSVFTLSQCQQCGMPDPENRIVGGSAARKHQYPWMVLMKVRYRAGLSMMEAQCGASIINDQWAVTAAHCFEQPQGAQLDSVNLGIGKQYSKQHESDELDLKAQRVIVNKNFNRQSMKNDIAMVKFDRKLDFKKLGVKPICLPSANGLNSVDKDKCMASGWGKTQAGKNLIYISIYIFIIK